MRPCEFESHGGYLYKSRFFMKIVFWIFAVLWIVLLMYCPFDSEKLFDQYLVDHTNRTQLKKQYQIWMFFNVFVGTILAVVGMIYMGMN